MTQEDDGTDDDWFVNHIFHEPLFRNDPKHVAAAVSGGSDSMALLSYLCLWAADKDVQVSAITVDHGLRDGSDREAADVAAHCAERGIAHKTLRWSSWDGAGNLQAKARDARYALMADYARTQGIDTIALGHTEDDQAETYLMRLARKAGVDGLAQMETRFRRNGVTWVRPLLRLSRAQARAHLERQQIKWVDDPSNDDARFDRVQARNILKALEPLGITSRALAASSHHLAMARDALDHYTRQEAEKHAIIQGGDVLLPLDEPLPADIMRRLQVGALQWIGRGSYAPRTRALADLEHGLLTTGAQTLAGCYVTRSETHTRYAREWNAVRDVKAATNAVWDGRWQLSGPHAEGLEIRALGEDGLRDCPSWRDSGLPRASALSSPGIWRGNTLISAPLAGVANGWQATLWQPYSQFLLHGAQPK